MSAHRRDYVRLRRGLAKWAGRIAWKLDGRPPLCTLQISTHRGTETFIDCKPIGWRYGDGGAMQSMADRLARFEEAM